jgi:hypothetical protein
MKCKPKFAIAKDKHEILIYLVAVALPRLIKKFYILKHSCYQ